VLGITQACEPYQDKDGQISLAYITGTGRFETITAAEIFDEAKTSDDNRKIYRRMLAHAAWMLPGKIAPGDAVKADNLPELEARIVRYLAKYVWIKDDRAYDLLACWVISSYFRDSFRFLPLIILDGTTISGKSTLQEALANICYHGVFFTNYSSAAVTRMIKHGRVTVCLDESIDNVSGDRGLDLINLIKSVTSPEARYIRAVPKTRDEVEVINTFTNLALSIRGAEVPQDILNRGIRIQMLSKPQDIEVGSLGWADIDDMGTDITPMSIRTDLYNLMMRSKLPPREEALDLEPLVRRAMHALTTQLTNGVWEYAFLCGMKHAPKVSNRQRDIASALLPIASASLCDLEIMQLILEEEEQNKESARNSREGGVFCALVDCIIEEAMKRSWIDKALPFDHKIFVETTRKITTRRIALTYNNNMHDSGDIKMFDQIPTRTVTCALKTLGIAYTMGHGAGSRASTINPTADGFLDLFERQLAAYDPTNQDFFKDIEN